MHISLFTIILYKKKLQIPCEEDFEWREETAHTYLILITSCGRVDLHHTQKVKHFSLL